MNQTSAQALLDLKHLPFKAPRVPIFDGRGAHWRPHTTDPEKLKEYTLTTQVTDAFDFKTMIQSAAQEYAPDCIIHLGPGGNLGGAIVQSLVDIGWAQLHSKSDFIHRQSSEPLLLSSDRSDQRQRILQ